MMRWFYIVFLVFHLHLYIDIASRLITKLYYKRDDFLNFPVVNFPFICSTFLTAPAYEVYIS